jgi:hypothetical protein
MTMYEALIDRILRDEAQVQINRGSSYLRSYPEFLRYFRDLPVIDEHHLIIAANFAYGWMPTILHFKSDGFAEAVALLNRVKTGELLTDDELFCLNALINKSMVGVSKLLHFINPEQYAIWDRRVATYVRSSPGWTGGYLSYLDLCRSTIGHVGFPAMHHSINAKVGYPVTGMRAVELVMYTVGGLSAVVEAV